MNDQFGHTAGDSALIFLADCLQKTFRSNDILGRAGGDELIAYMEGVCNRNIAQKKVELLMYYIRQSTSQGLPFISVSIGIALCPDDGMSYEELFTAADQAMYEAKNRGKMQAQFYGDMA
ncbi:MAG: GGDEF domain-containing protein [[Clostridium] symbiosum]